MYNYGFPQPILPTKHPSCVLDVLKAKLALGTHCKLKFLELPCKVVVNNLNLLQGKSKTGLPPIQIQPPSMGSVLDMLNIINGILFVQISQQVVSQSVIHLFIHSFIYSFIHSFIHLFIYSFIHSFIVFLSIPFQLVIEF